MNRRLSVFLISTALLTLILLGKALFLAVQAQSTLLWAESYPVQLRVSKLDKSNIAIRRNDVNAGLPTVQLSSATYTVNENAGAVVVTFLLSHASTQHVTVDFATNRGTANDGEDYERTSGTIGFGPGMTSTTLDTLIINDIISEGNETFNLVLTSPSGATLGVPNTAVITIIDNDQPAAFSCNNVTEIPKTECDALVALSNSTSGPNWLDHTDWLATNTPCSWYGITCNAGHVTEVFLYNNQLNGTIPLDLSNLQALQKLNLSFNGLNGSIPPQLGNLSNLLEFTLAFNQLSGNIPVELSNISSLKYLDLTSNQLSGTMPPTLGSLNRLSTLLLSKNQLSGSVPSELGNLVNLQYLYLDNNLFDGALPSNLVNLTRLTHFWFQNTGLCEPGESAFQTWLASIVDLNRTGVICSSTGNTIITAVAGGGNDTCALTNSGGVKCWGNNFTGGLGDGTTVDRYTPVDVNGLSNGVTVIAVGNGGHACAVKSGGVKCWGNGGHGRLGDGTTTSRLTPVDVVGLSSGATAITTGHWHTCAVVSSGVKCWGDNSHGQLGDGTTISHTAPVSVVGLNSGVKNLAAGNFHTCALMTNGTVRCWGNNFYGQLGDGNAGVDDYLPVAVSGLDREVMAIAASGGHTCAIMNGGGVKCWGDNGYGELGDGTKTARFAPTDVVGLSSGTTSIAAGGGRFFYTCAVNSGSAKCWGANNFGQLGDNTTIDRLTPTTVQGLTAGMSNGLLAIEDGEFHSCGVTSSGGVKCWGDNTNGQLGNGTTTNSLVPVDVQGLGEGVSPPTSTPTSTPVPPTNTPIPPTNTPISPTASPTNAPTTFKVTGTIENYLNGGINGVMVKIGDQTAISDIYGQFSIANLSNGTHNVSFALSHYTFSHFSSSITIQGADLIVDAIGNYTDPSVDSGFRPSLNGFDFRNFGYTSESWDIFKRTFPNTQMENSDGSHKKAAESFYLGIYKGVGTDGNCYGFSQASIIWFTGLRAQETVERNVLMSPNSTAATVHSMIPRRDGNVGPGQSDVKDYIHIYQGRALSVESDPLHMRGNSSLIMTLQAIKDGLANFFNSAFSITIPTLEIGKGHSLVPFRVEHVGLVDRVYVYDGNFPNDDNKYIEIDVQQNSWAYQYNSSTIWRGDSSVLGLKLTRNNFPSSLSLPTHAVNTSITTDSPRAIISVVGNVVSQLIDPAGHRLGIVNGQMIEEIPGASIRVTEQFNPNDPTMLTSILYYLPVTTTYTVDVQATNTTVYTVTDYTNGTATSLQGIETDNGAHDHILIESGLRTLVLQGNQVAKDFCYTFADDNLNDASRAFVLCTSSAPNSQTSFSVATDSTGITYVYTGSPTNYNLLVEQTGQDAGSQTFNGQASSSNPLTIRIGSIPDPNTPGGIGWEINYSNYLPIVIR